MLRNQSLSKEPTTSQTFNQQAHTIQSNNYHKMSFGRFEEDKTINEQLHQLTLSYDITNEALEKATLMVQLLEQQRVQLLALVQNLQSEIVNKNSQIVELRNKIYTTQVIPSQQLYTTPEKKSEFDGNKLLFSFSQPTNATKKANFHIVSPSTKEVRPGVTVSQQLSPWNATKGIFQELAEVLSQQDSHQQIVNQIDRIINHQSKIVESVQSAYRKRSSQLVEQFESNLLQSSDLSLSSLKEYTSSTEKEEVISPAQLFRQYQRIISNYRSYSAHLKAYLCEAINYITSISQYISLEGKDYRWRLQAIHSSIQQAAISFASIQKYHKHQNKQLAGIIEEIIINIKKVQYAHGPQLQKRYYDFQ